MAAGGETMEFDGKVAVITGVGAGIAKMACEKLLELGADVIGADIVDEQSVCPAFLSNARFHYRKTDVTDEAQVSELFSFVDKKYGRLDILLNIAGGWKTAASIEETAFEEWHFMMSLNTDSVFLTCRAGIPLMKRNRYGRIVNFASIAGRQPLGRSTIGYAASKAAVVGMTKYLAGEVSRDGITVNAVSPSTTLTERVKSVRTPDDIERIQAKIPVGRLAEPEDSVNAILFFISEKSSYITGHTIDVAGGVYMN